MEFNEIWEKIIEYQGEEFKTVTGIEFTYHVKKNILVTSRTERGLSKENFRKAYALMPTVKKPGDMTKIIHGSSYVYSILNDKRISIKNNKEEHMKIALIACTKSKKNYECQAKELYSSSELFSVSYNYAKALNVDEIYILSAKYGLVNEEDLLKPYEKSMKDLSPQQQMAWGHYVKNQLQNEFDLCRDDFIVLSGMDYLTPLLKAEALPRYTFPLRGMDYFKRIVFMKNEVKRLQESLYKNDNSCWLLHKWFNNIRMYDYSEINSINFENGIYIIFEKGEKYQGFYRVVRVGTHTSANRLKARLKDHYIINNKEGSIFRKNIGKTILSKSKDRYLFNWNMNTSKQENKKYIIPDIQNKIEEEVTSYLQENTFFTVFEVKDVNQRLRLESGIIATLNACIDFQKSSSWLGNDSPEYEIRDSGMWLKKGLNDQILSVEEMYAIKDCIAKNNVSSEDKLENSNIVKEQKKLIENIPKFTTDSAVDFIKNILRDEHKYGKSECVLISGDIAKKMGVIQRDPMICAAMRKVMGYKDEVLYSPPKGNGTTLKIKYYL